MNYLLKLLPSLSLVLILAGCSAQKSVTRSTAATSAAAAASQASYIAALDALDNHRFIIWAREFYFPSSETPVKYSSDSYVRMSNGLAVVRFSPELFPQSPLGSLNISDKAAEVTKLKSLKNGDQQYRIKIDGGKQWLKEILLITVFKNSNECTVQLKGYNADALIVTFRGQILPVLESDGSKGAGVE